MIHITCTLITSHVHYNITYTPYLYVDTPCVYVVVHSPAGVVFGVPLRCVPLELPVLLVVEEGLAGVGHVPVCVRG